MTPAISRAAQPAPARRTLLLAGLAMAFFSTNSLLARFALRAGEIDWGSFTAVRIVAGALALVLLTGFRPEGLRAVLHHGSLRAAIALFTYSLAFSYAYLSLNAGTGALVLFAAVQMTMLAIGIAGGERPAYSEWIGLAMALGGLVSLALPGLAAPSAVGLSVMALSGASWGYYSLAARGFSSMVAATAGNFARAVPLALAALILVWRTGHVHATWFGIGLAAVSGAVASGLGYAIWYVAVKNLRTSVAAVVQLTVPVLTAIAGVLLLGEQLTWRLALASIAILGGVALALSGRARSLPGQ
ncbi:MAG TPA: DMT family transporter [Candidatus Limnocylindrales bacterium]|nr:DMT family transporter [Candidatus Limnocylindrales bacterium]